MFSFSHFLVIPCITLKSCSVYICKEFHTPLYSLFLLLLYFGYSCSEFASGSGSAGHIKLRSADGKAMCELSVVKDSVDVTS